MRSIKLLPNQVPQLWPAIKYTAIVANNVKEEFRPGYLNSLLADLLNDKAQCFVRMDDNRQLIAMALTRLVVDSMTGEKSLLIESLYSYKIVPTDRWIEERKLAEEFARNNNCTRILVYSSSDKIFNLMTNMGFGEVYRCFAYDLRGV